MTRDLVVYWNNIPAPYMVDRFNALARRGAFPFEAWFSHRTEPGRSWQVDESSFEFPYRFLPRGLPLPLVRGPVPRLVVSLYGEPAFVAGSLLARARGARTAFWAEVTFEEWQPRRRSREWLKRRLFRRVDGVITPGDDGRRFAERYGASPERIFLAPHAVDVDAFARAAAAARLRRDELRAELGARGVIFLYVGRLWRGKGLTTLLDAFAAVRQNGTAEATLVLAGDGEEEAELRRRAEPLGGVVFAGFRGPGELPALYAAADVFVFPTLGDPWGLVVEEAMASGLPVICTSAAGEIGSRMDDGVEGFVVPPADAAALAARMQALAGDPALRERMGTAATRRGADRGPDDWAADFEAAVEAILAEPT